MKIITIKTIFSSGLNNFEINVMDHILREGKKFNITNLGETTHKNMLVCRHPTGSTRNVRVKIFL